MTKAANQTLALLFLIFLTAAMSLKVGGQQMDLDKTVRAYADLTKRTILIPFDLPAFTEPFSTSSTNRAELKAAVETIFEKHHISVRLQGERFAVIVPSDHANFIGQHEIGQPKPIPVTQGGINTGEVNFHDMDVEHILPTYADLIGEKGVVHDASYNSSIFAVARNHRFSLFTDGSVNKADVLYSLDQIFNYYYFKLVPADDHYLKVVLLAH